MKNLTKLLSLTMVLALLIGDRMLKLMKTGR